jgi:hypothetical protein
MKHSATHAFPQNAFGLPRGVVITGLAAGSWVALTLFCLGVVHTFSLLG